jgi:predicted RNase H-like HicB family nuclease
MAKGEFTAIYVHAGDWWAAKVAEVPGVNSQGRSLEEARENLQDALTQMLEILEEEANHFGQGGEIVKETIVRRAS